MIRKTLTTLLAGVALTAGLAAPALATEVIPTNSVFPPVDMQFGAGLDTFGFFSDSFASAGTTFDDVFLFYSPDVASTLYFDAAPVYAGSGATVKFSGFSFGVFNGLTDDGVDLIALGLDKDESSSTKFFLTGTLADYQNSGIYYVEIKGVSVASNAEFDGHINTTAIPEPANAALLLAGLGLVATMVRRRKQQG